MTPPVLAAAMQPEHAKEIHARRREFARRHFAGRNPAPVRQQRQMS
jgi:hypothetical protein